MPSNSWTDSLSLNQCTESINVLMEDVLQFIRINPTVIKVDPIPTKPDHYLVTERLNMLGMTYNHRFKAFIKKEHDIVKSEAWSFPNIHVKTQFTVKEDTMHINTTLSAPWYMISFATKAAQKGRILMIQNLKKKLKCSSHTD